MSSTSIEWTDTTWNPVRGCTKVSPGCAHCYAETFAERFRGVKGHPYEQGFDLRLVPEKLAEPLSWKKPRRVFVNSMSDLFQDGVPDEYIAEVWRTMFKTPRHTYQVLTKRADRMRSLMPRLVATFGVVPNVWLGVSVENQHFADERIPLLLQTPAAVRFISAEPLLERVNLDLRGGTFDPLTGCGNRERLGEWEDTPSLDWVIVGGESGHGARPFEVSWARRIVAQCKAAGVACFVKQLGSNASDAAAERDDMGSRDVWPAGWMPTIEGRRVWRPDLADRKGGDPREWPPDLRVRQFPQPNVSDTVSR